MPEDLKEYTKELNLSLSLSLKKRLILKEDALLLMIEERLNSPMTVFLQIMREFFQAN
jgi:hypothetical protein